MALRKGIVSVAGQKVKVSRGLYRVWGSRLESVAGWWWKKSAYGTRLQYIPLVYTVSQNHMQLIQTVCVDENPPEPPKYTW